mgnify:CR=1 FL=1
MKMNCESEARRAVENALVTNGMIATRGPRGGEKEGGGGDRGGE